MAFTYPHIPDEVFHLAAFLEYPSDHGNDYDQTRQAPESTGRKK